MMCKDELKESITKIYSNDGPGISQERIDPLRYDRIKDKIVKIVPEFSIVGLLFEKKVIEDTICLLEEVNKKSKVEQLGGKSYVKKY